MSEEKIDEFLEKTKENIKDLFEKREYKKALLAMEYALEFYHIRWKCDTEKLKEEKIKAWDSGFDHGLVWGDEHPGEDNSINPYKNKKE